MTPPSAHLPSGLTHHHLSLRSCRSVHHSQRDYMLLPHIAKACWRNPILSSLLSRQACALFTFIHSRLPQPVLLLYTPTHPTIPRNKAVMQCNCKSDSFICLVSQLRTTSLLNWSMASKDVPTTGHASDFLLWSFVLSDLVSAQRGLNLY